MFWNKLFNIGNTDRDNKGTENTVTSGNLKVIVMSDKGNIRINNEDIGLFFRIADDNDKGSLLIVADGMGGHQAGEVASKMATDIVVEKYFYNSSSSSIEKNLAIAFSSANRSIFELASSSKRYKGMGTTCTAIIVLDSRLYYAHVGDSRAYIIKKNGIRQITQDHTYVNELIRTGEISKTEAATHPKRNVLTNAMGTKADLQVDSSMDTEPFEESDRLLLCSDGLYEYLTDEEMASILSTNSIMEAANIMIAEAKNRGGHDNITVIIAEKSEINDELTAKETRDLSMPETREYQLP